MKRKISIQYGYVGPVDACMRKRAYSDRLAVRMATRLAWRGEHVTPYKCPHCGMCHFTSESPSLMARRAAGP